MLITMKRNETDNKVKLSKAKSRAVFGRAGAGRKTHFLDRKKEKYKNWCRENEEE